MGTYDTTYVEIYMNVFIENQFLELKKKADNDDFSNRNKIQYSYITG